LNSIKLIDEQPKKGTAKSVTRLKTLSSLRKSAGNEERQQLWGISKLQILGISMMILIIIESF
jgi:hypothetical protein